MNTAHTTKRKAYRIFNRNGTMNISKTSSSNALFSDTYHSLFVMGWKKFFLLVLCGYLSVNIFFGLVYYFCGPDSLEGVHRDSPWLRFLDCYFFSIQTFATIGYGKISPSGFLANCAVAAEAFLGMSSIAVGTGLLFARFSKPTAKVVFSNYALFSKHDGKDAFIFRVANSRYNNQILEANMSVVLVKTVVLKGGERFRNLYDLKLDRDHSPVFGLSWTAVHFIDSNSPLYGMREEDFCQGDCEITVSLVGIDATFSQTVHARFSYTVDDFRWDQRFKDILSRLPDGKIHIDLRHMHELESQQNIGMPQ